MSILFQCDGCFSLSCEKEIYEISKDVRNSFGDDYFHLCKECLKDINYDGSLCVKNKKIVYKQKPVTERSAQRNAK